MIKKLTIKGMNSNQMEDRIVHMLRNVSGVSDAKINNNTISIYCIPETQDANIVKAIKVLGYSIDTLA